MYSTGYYCHIVMELEFSTHIFEKTTNIKFHENPSDGSRVVSCGKTDMTKLIVASRILRTRQKKIGQTNTQSRD